MTRALRHLRVTAGLIGLALLTASLAPADVQRTQLVTPVQLQTAERFQPPRARPQIQFPQTLQAPAAKPDAAPTPTTPPTPAAPTPPAAVTPAPPAAVPAAAPVRAPLPPEAMLKMVRTEPEELGQVPGNFFWIRKGLQAAQDPVDGQIVFMNDEGRVLGRATLPSGFIIEEIFPDAKEVRLIGTVGRQVTIPRTIDPAAAGALQAKDVASKGNVRLVRPARRNIDALLYRDDRRAGSRVLTIRSVAGGMLAQIYEIGPGSGDSRYIVSEEIASVQPAMKVRVFIQRFDREGKLTGVIHVPLDEMDSVPRDFIAVTGEGNVRVLVPTVNGIKIDEIEFTPPPRAGRRLGDDELKGIGRLLRTTPLDGNAIGEKRTLLRREGPTFEVAARMPPIKRDVILRNARAFLTVNWSMQRENFTRPGVENTCQPGSGKYWMRPRSFTEAMIGTTIGPMPYRWGGDDTPDTFRVRTQLGALAGDICTCRSAANNYCLFNGSAGVDCSGYVSRAWGIEKRGTFGLVDVSDSVGSLGELKAGDAFNWAGRHVRLLVSRAPGAAIAFTVLESTTRRDCEGVCQRTYRPSELNGYQLIRYRGVTDTGTVEAKR